MNRLIVPGAGVAGLALVVSASVLLPVQQPGPDVAPPDDRARVAVACPTLAGTANPTTVAAGSPQANLTTAALTDPTAQTAVAGTVALRDQVPGPTLVAAPRQDVFSGTTRTAAATGSDRGLSMMSCTRPAASHWFAGVTASAAGAAELVLLNADNTDAAVDIAVHGESGRLPAPGSRGIIVGARSSRVVPLGPLFTSEQPVSLHVTTSAGRVATAVRQRMLSGTAPAGSDWLPPTADPATQVIIPGLPAGPGGRELVLLNPGERTASVALTVLGSSGPTAIPGFETIDLPAGTSRSVPIGSALAQSAAGLRLTSEQPVTAAVLTSSGTNPAQSDSSTQVATGALTGPGVLAVAPGGNVAPALHVSNSSATPTPARVLVTSATSTVLIDTVVTVPGLANTSLTLPAAEAMLVRVEPGTPGTLHASVAITRQLGGVTGIASLAILPGAAATVLPPIREDPRVGS